MTAMPPPRGPAPDPHAAPPTWPAADRTFRTVRRLTWLYGAAATLVLVGVLASRRLMPFADIPRELVRSGLLGAVAGALLVALAGLAGTLALAWARHVSLDPAAVPAAAMPRRRWRVPRLRLPAASPGLIGRVARRPQGIVIPALALSAGAAAWLMRPVSMAPPSVSPSLSFLIGGTLIVLAFPLLVAERVVAGIPEQRLPEAPALTALLFVPVVVWPLAGCLELAAGVGLDWSRVAGIGVAAFLVLVSAELALRALANWFLPPPDPARARAAVTCLSARLLRPASLAPNGFAEPIRQHFGIDFSRSWALKYLRAAALPVTAAMLLVCWGLSGVGLVDLDQRGIYERFGEPVAVLRPGLHTVLPWPLGRIRRTELGVVHSIPLGLGDGRGGVVPAEAKFGAEDVPPPTADRLWDAAHPAETSYLIASESAGRQSFQTVSVDMRVLYRVGLDDHAALRATYGEAEPETLVRAEAGRLAARFFATRTLLAVLGASRENLAGELRSGLQAQLDRLDSGIELIGVVIEAIHPPTGAAAAYHNVQAAEIAANTQIASERGRAIASQNLSLQNAVQVTNGAQSVAAETVGGAEVELRHFAADQLAAQSGGRAFLLERYFANLSLALAKSPLVIVDHRLQAPDAPVIDLRPFADPRASVEPD